MKNFIVMKTDFLFVLVILVSFLIQLLFLYPLPANFEDSFITYRYIKSISDLQFFAWNFDKNPVYGMTGLIFPAVAGILNMLISNPIASATLVGSLASLLFLGILLNKTFGYKDKYVILLLVVFSSIFLLSATNGLETSFVFLILAICFSVKNIWYKPITASFLSIVAFLIRPDIVLVIGFFSLYSLCSRSTLKAFLFTLDSH